MKEKKQSVLGPIALSVFFESLSGLLQAGLPIQQCLSLMAEDAPEHGLEGQLAALSDHLLASHYLHIAMEELGTFPGYAVSMVKIGEFSGKLESVCSELSSYYEAESQRNAQVRSTVTSPLILIGIMAVVIAFLVTSVLPIFGSVYAQMGMNINDNSLIRAALLIGNIAMWLLFAVLAVAIIAALFSLSRSGKRFFGKLFERSFATRKFSYQFGIARFTSSLCIMLQSGQDIVTSLELASEVCQNSILREKLAPCIEEVRAGQSLGNALYEHKIYSASHSSMLMSSIKSGSMEQALARLARIYEQDASQRLDRFLSIIEPALVGVLSVVIGIILLCIMLPLIGIMSSIS